MTTARATSGIWRKWLPRAAGSALVLALLFWFLPREAILAGIARVPLGMFFAVFAGFLAGHAVAAAKWWVLLGRAIPFGLAVRAHFAGLAANLGLPGVAGGDAVRAALVLPAMGDGARLAAGAVADRLIDLLALASLALIGALMVQSGADFSGLAIRIVALMIAVLVLAVIAVPRLVPRLWARFPALPARALAERTAGAFGALGRRPALLVALLILSMGVQGLFIALAAQFAMAIGVAVPFGAWMLAWSLAKLLAVLPISLGGLGVREASLAALLAPFGAAAAEVVAAGLVWQAVLFLTGGLGALMLGLTGFGLGAAPSGTNGGRQNEG